MTFQVSNPRQSPAPSPPSAYARPVLRIIDARNGEPVDAVPARRGLTRVEAHVPGHDASGLRVLLVADVLLRALELGGTPVWALLTADRDRAELHAGAADLGVRPFEDAADVGPAWGESQVIHVVGEGGATPDGVRVGVAPVETLADVAGTDPTVLRLALLTPPRNTPVRLDESALGRARETLVRWRRAVAAWARQPSRPVPDEVRGRLRTAWEDDLDVPEVLRVLTWVEESELPEGARFETYVYADRLLGLELARDLGCPS
ncbi:L-cysteine:1D-myo-inositol 2-amino-2-deoxy-alpha-D-glucopyranoside ligase OS=Streptomyces griseorubiginosus OX=67304 GN=mshC_2 PE=4 SV=1 [Streptomyces griseorubiginosus]